MAIKPGIFKVLTHQACWAKSSGKGTDYVAVVVEAFDDAGASIGVSDGQIWWTPATKDRAVKALQAIGWGGETAPDGSLVGPFKTTNGCFKMEEWNGQSRLKLDWLGEPPFGATLPKEELRLTAAQAKLLAAEVRASMGLDTKTGF